MEQPNIILLAQMMGVQLNGIGKQEVFILTLTDLERRNKMNVNEMSLLWQDYKEHPDIIKADNYRESHLSVFFEEKVFLKTLNSKIAEYDAILKNMR